jgi:hypothetical protein
MDCALGNQEKAQIALCATFKKIWRFNNLAKAAPRAPNYQKARPTNLHAQKGQNQMRSQSTKQLPTAKPGHTQTPIIRT